MKPPKFLVLAATAAAALIALAAAGTASATVLCSEQGTGSPTGSNCPTGKAYAAATSLHAVASGVTKLTTTFKTVECNESTIAAKTENEGKSGEAVKASVETLSFGSCNCTVTTLKKGSLSVSWISGSHNGTLSSNGAELTVSCSTIFGTVHCLYATENTDLGTATGGNPSKVDIESANVPRLATSALCSEKGNWDATYEITSPKPLYYSGAVGSGATETTLTTSLSGEGKSGEEITVNEGSKVKDTATLSGTNASKATGTVKYKVYSDKECKELVTNAGEVTVSEGKVPASEEKELEAGRVYYWQAEYSGDSNNLKSTSTCGKEVLTVKAATSIATSLSGEAKSGEEITVNEGAKVKDTATLSGTKSSTATGKVKFKVYKDKECKELATEAGEGSLSEGKATSEEKTLEAGLLYYWQAEYPGDSLHQSSTSACSKEVLAVKATISLTTTLSDEEHSEVEIEVEEEVGVTDKATLSGTNVSKATGTVKYNVYSDVACKELVEPAGEFTVSGGSVPASSEVELPGGLYYWQAVYSGDPTHTAATGTCGSEIEVVTEPTSITTSLYSEGETGEELEMLDDALAYDTATLSGTNASEATGTVDYQVYADEECEELVADAGTVLVDEGEVPPSEAVSLAAGTYYWQATYSGDSINRRSTSTCGLEVLQVEVEPLTTSLSGEETSGVELEVDEETPVTDTATLNTANAETATGTVEYNVYADEECEELVESAGKVTVSGGSIPASSEVTLPTGVYYWQALYSGDLTHPETGSICGVEILTVAASTSLTTSLSGEEESGKEIEVQEGAGVSDSATLSGANASEAGGVVEYEVYADSKCEELVAFAGSVEVAKGEIPESEAMLLPAGTYYWQVTYFGDSSNQGSVSTCGDEVVQVNIAPLTLELTGEEEKGSEIEVASESPVTGDATLNIENAETATGTVEYKIYADNECKELVKSAGEVTVAGGIIPSSTEQALSEGVYYWQASYSGDKGHAPAKSICDKAVEQAKGVWIVSVGDSYISGEGGRWAGNTAKYGESKRIDAHGPNAYKNPANGEKAGEAIALCHRSTAAEIFIKLPPVNSKNLACSGAKVASESTGTVVATVFNNKFVVFKGTYTPGLDFTDVKETEEIPAPGKGRCGLSVCKGQAQMLREFAEERLKNKETIKMVVVSIGGNDFGFPALVKACVVAYKFGGECSKQAKQVERFEAANLKAKQERIEAGLNNVGSAMEKAGFKKGDYTILVQDYPSPIPEAKAKFRYLENPPKPKKPFVKKPPNRVNPGGCPFKDADAEWANATGLKKIDETVKKAYEEVSKAGKYSFKYMELESSFNGRRLCETGVQLVNDARAGKKYPRWTAPGAVDGTEWINQIRILTAGTPFDQQEGFHPNYWGQLALRNCVRQAYNNGAPKGGTCARAAAGGLTAPPGAPKPPKVIPQKARPWDWEPNMELK